MSKDLLESNVFILYGNGVRRAYPAYRIEFDWNYFILYHIEYNNKLYNNYKFFILN